MSFVSSAAYAIAMKESHRPAIAVVTGGKSGIGKAIAAKIATFPFIDTVVAVSRSIQPSDVADINNNNSKVEALAADVTTPEGRDAIVQHIAQLCGTEKEEEEKKKQVRFLVHGAGSIHPIKSVLEVQPDELRNAMIVNCEAPLLLTTALYPYMEKVPKDPDSVAGRVLHVSSGAAHGAPPEVGPVSGAAHGAPPVGWSCYGISKAAFFQSFKVLEREFREKGSKVIVGSFKPGVVDTAMQGKIRDSSKDDMPVVQNFRKMKDSMGSAGILSASEAKPPPKGALDTADNVSFFAEYLLLGTSDEEFSNKDDPNEWDIRNEALYPRWIKEVNLPKE
eukprot:CAMPEP_0116577676 /NCGR_PEP_ID=MMETSP0397-20121206/21281_1 /TAXON_ID=216820 /ORGANISM="Cyclophora tenuis, Strain ECT3854" /LENGTH=334 /DNA_ID=CAMNT_0004106977 /DNA_START=111 /DNA_END=1116 /DNA_ORIENTATION=+